MSKTVLIVDDSIPLHKLVKAHLEPDSITLHSAYDGESALSTTATLRPDLILLDVDMPQLDGFEVCRRLSANSDTAAIPVIFLTADSILADKVKGLDLGAIDYITKPFKPEELRARVRCALRTKHGMNRTAMVDGLSGLWNRAYLDLQLPALASLARRTGRPLACIVVDVDRLASINARHGEAIGGEVLRKVGRILLGQCRAEDVLCRLDGGKFAIMVPNADCAAAARMTDRLRSDVERQLRTFDGVDLGATCSFGVADTHVVKDGMIFDRADAAVYRAKQAGRNCVFVARAAGEDIHAAA